MVANFPGPYELRFRYTTTPVGLPGIEHTARYNVQLTADPNPGDAFNNINAVTRGGISTPDLASAVEAWLTLLQPRFNTTTVFGQWELWRYQPLTFDATFVSSYNPTIVAGTGSSTAQAQQDIYTFRTVEGGIMKLNLLEGISVGYGRFPYPSGSASIDAIFNFVTGSTNWLLARDTSYPFSALNYLVGQNEKTFRQRFR